MNLELGEFQEFRKIPRLSRECVVTEKIDGTNAAVVIEQSESGDYLVRAQSRTRFITPEADNFGFAKWAKQNEQRLIEFLGVGRHFGEWWGVGIQRGYDLRERRFSLFNTSRFEDTPQFSEIGVYVVPVLYKGQFSTEEVDRTIFGLRAKGSAASPGYMKPEGVVVYHVAGNLYFKKTLEKDEQPKGKAA